MLPVTSTFEATGHNRRQGTPFVPVTNHAPSSAHEVARRFERFAAAEGYEVMPSFPIRTEDPSLLFLNSTMAAFKTDIARSVSIEPPVALVQQCFRGKVDSGHLHAFKMLGVLSDIGKLETVYRDTLKFLVSEIGLSSKRLHVVLNFSDIGLLDLSQQHFLATHIHDHKGNEGKYFTRWKFGKNTNLTGRGLTLAYASDGRPSSDIYHKDTLLPLGNVILVAKNDGDPSYVETGFGAEMLCSASMNINLFQTRPYEAAVACVEPFANAGPDAKLLVKLYLGASVLVEHGFVPGAKSSNYLLRRLLRDAAVVLYKKSEGLNDLPTVMGKLGAVLNDILPEQVSSDALDVAKTIAIDEVKILCQSIRKTGKRLLAHEITLPSPNQQSIDTYLRSHFGIPPEITHDLLSKKPRLLADILKDEPEARSLRVIRQQSGVPSFSRSAPYYDKLYITKPYEQESKLLWRLVQEHRPNAVRGLDVGCGTGGHAKFLQQFLLVDGIDAEPEFVSIAQKKALNGSFLCQPMELFRFAQRYDVIFCLFSTIGWARTVRHLEQSIANMSRHLVEGGILFVEPWLTPNEYVENMTNMDIYDGAEIKVSRMSLTSREGNLSVREETFCIASASGVEVFEERFESGLFTRVQMEAAFASAGLSVQYDPVGLTGRGLYLGKKGSLQDMKRTPVAICWPQH